MIDLLFKKLLIATYYILMGMLLNQYWNQQRCCEFVRRES